MAEPNWTNRTVWTRDCLEVMRGMNSESVDLIYLDPSFNSKADYSAPVGSKAAGAHFRDTWTLRDVDVEWVNIMEREHPGLYRVLLAAMTASDKSYLAYMAVRLLEMRRILRLTGSIYLHCDPTMSHYLKLVMDAIFGRKQFRNEIVWCYRGGGVPRYDFARRHDTLLRYSPSEKPVFNVDDVRVPYSADSTERLKSRLGLSVRVGSTTPTGRTQRGNTRRIGGRFSRSCRPPRNDSAIQLRNRFGCSHAS